MRFRPIEYEPESAKPSRYARVVASKTLARQVKEIGIRKLARFIGCGRRILRKICRRQLIRASTLAEYEKKIQQHRLTHADKPAHSGRPVAPTSAPEAVQICNLR
jgi:hypothetical protein